MMRRHFYATAISPRAARLYSQEAAAFLLDDDNDALVEASLSDGDEKDER